MNRLLCFLALLFVAGTARAQTVSFRVYTEPAGAKFAVDGIIYTSTATFQWPVGSKHLVRYVQDLLPPSSFADPTAPTLGQISPDGAIVYKFGGWVDSNGLLGPVSDPNQTVTADPSVPWLKATVTINYRVLLNFLDLPPATLPPVCGAPGTAPSTELRVGLVFIGSQCYWNSAILYFPAGQKLTLNAFPYPGFVFLGWSGFGNSNAFLTSYVLNGPLTLVPTFSPAKRVRFETAPLGLQVLVDRTPSPTLDSADPNAPCPHNELLPVTVLATFTSLCRGDFDFAPGSQHLVGAATPQQDQQGKYWVFDSWGNGQGQNAIYYTGNQTATPDKVLVLFKPGVQTSFVTSPAGLKLNVDGRDNWPGYNFIWGVGTSHQVSAPAQQTDSKGRKWTFKSWSNGGPPAQSFTLDPSTSGTGFRMVAAYDGLSRLTLDSSPPGQKLLVDGTECTAPCVVDRPAGTQVRLTAPSSVALSDQMRLDLVSWSDGGAADHVYTINADSIVTATYSSLFRLGASSDPANGASFRFDPSSPDLFFPAETSVTVSADSKPGFRFRRWAGDLAGTYPSGTVSMSAPHQVAAMLDRVPYIAPTGVRNAAAETPDPAVAPGSLIAISGESLAEDTLQGRTNPLAQTLAGVTVTIADRYLPLVSVSPQQIVALLPSDLPPGDYTLQVHTAAQEDVTADFQLTRNAPGLFSGTAADQTTIMANHADGSPVNTGSPAKAGETITILGTGFGPYRTPLIDGFFPGNPLPQLADPVEVTIADQVVQPTWVGAAAETTGMTAIKIKIPDGLPSATLVDLTARVNGKPSNTAKLPTQ